MARLKTPLETWLAKRNKSLGLHDKIFAYACFLVNEGYSAEQIHGHMREICDQMDRPVPEKELESAIKGAFNKALGIGGACVTWPSRDQDFQQRVLQQHKVNYDQLIVHIPPARSAGDYLRELYRENDLICVGYTAFEFETLPVDLWLKRESLTDSQFINPSPMSAWSGLTKEGKYSEHSSANTGPRVYVVVEFDENSWLEHASILKFLASSLPLVMMVFSGQQSLHGWFNTSHIAEQEVKEFYDVAVRLGADPKLFSPCQFARLPMGRNGLQRVIHFNPKNCHGW